MIEKYLTAIIVVVFLVFIAGMHVGAHIVEKQAQKRIQIDRQIRCNQQWMVST